MAIITGKPFSQYPLVTAPSASTYFPAVDPTRATNDKNIRVPIGMMNLGGDAQAIKTSITSGVSSQYVSFSPVFTGVPYLYSTLETSNELYVYNLSGVSAAGFNVVFSAPVATTGLKLCTFATTEVDGLGVFSAGGGGVGGDTYAATLNASGNISSGVYYVNTGSAVNLNLPSTPDNGRMFIIKNRGGAVTLSGQAGIKLFTSTPVDTLSLASGDAYTVIYDGYYWNVM